MADVIGALGAWIDGRKKALGNRLQEAVADPGALYDQLEGMANDHARAYKASFDAGDMDALMNDPITGLQGAGGLANAIRVFHGTHAEGLTHLRQLGKSADIAPHVSTVRETADLFAAPMAWKGRHDPGTVIMGEIDPKSPLEVPDMGDWPPSRLAETLSDRLGTQASALRDYIMEAADKAKAAMLEKLQPGPVKEVFAKPHGPWEHPLIDNGYIKDMDQQMHLEDLFDAMPKERKQAQYAALRDYLNRQRVDALKYKNTVEGPPADTYILTDPSIIKDPSATFRGPIVRPPNESWAPGEDPGFKPNWTPLTGEGFHELPADPVQQQQALGVWIKDKNGKWDWKDFGDEGLHGPKSPDVTPEGKAPLFLTTDGKPIGNASDAGMDGHGNFLQSLGHENSLETTKKLGLMYVDSGGGKTLLISGQHDQPLDVATRAAKMYANSTGKPVKLAYDTHEFNIQPESPGGMAKEDWLFSQDD